MHGNSNVTLYAVVTI